jgi:hypothetical protein
LMSPLRRRSEKNTAVGTARYRHSLLQYRSPTKETIVKTIGTVVLAALAASAAGGLPTATITGPYAGLARPPVNERLDLRSLLDRQIGRLLALENPAGVNAGPDERSNQSTVSTNKRLSSRWRPLSPSLPGISGSAPPAGK